MREKKVIPNVIYRPPHGNFSLFLQEIENFILESEINEADIIYWGGFKIWVGDIRNNHAQNFLRLLNNFSLDNVEHLFSRHVESGFVRGNSVVVWVCVQARETPKGLK